MLARPLSISLGRARTAAAHVAAGLLDLLYPPACLGCGERVAEPDLPLCFACSSGLERAAPEALAAELGRLPEAAAIDRAFALWTFDKAGLLQRLQHGLKYGNRPRYGLALGRRMGAAARLAPADAVVPVPLHPTRLRARGYNQSEWLARGVAEACSAEVWPDALLRSRSTRSQTRLSRRARWTNVADAFHVPAPSRIEGRTLVLVDDVVTTGATAAAAAQALRDGGARAVHLVALALARS